MTIDIKRITRGLRSFAREQAKRIPGRTAAVLNSALGSRSSGTAILVYHRIWDSARDSFPTMNVSPGRFRIQMESLLSAGYRFVSLGELCNLAHQERIPERTLVVTFDDIFQNVYQNAFPILAELEIPATVFVATAFLDSTDPFPFDKWGRDNRHHLETESYLPITTPQCHTMLSSGLVEIGAHTHTHSRFADAEAFQTDLQLCVNHLRHEFQLEQVSFAFPFGRRSQGHVTDEMIERVQHLGLSCALSTDCAPIDECSTPFTWGRFNIYEWDTVRTINGKIGGWYNWAHQLQDFLIHSQNDTKR